MVNIDNDMRLYNSPKLFFVDSQQLLALTVGLLFLPLGVACDSAPHLPRLPHMWHSDVDFVFGEVQHNLEILTLRQCHLLLKGYFHHAIKDLLDFRRLHTFFNAILIYLLHKLTESIDIRPYTVNLGHDWAGSMRGKSFTVLSFQLIQI